MKIRKMREEDLLQIAELEKNTFSQPWSAEGFRGALHLADACFLVAIEGEQVRGYIGMYSSAPEGEITNVAVEPSARQQGVGTALVLAMQKEAAARAVSAIYLEVRDSNEPAICLYRKTGFTEVGKRKDFYSFPKEDARVMAWRMD